MKHITTAAFTVAVLTLAFALAWAGAGSANHSHDDLYAAVEPGDSTKSVRVVQITMGEADGKMFFTPSKVDVKLGEQINFALRNAGELDHEFVPASTADNQKHAEAMMKHPNMEHDDPNAKKLAPKKADEIIWKFSKAGEFEFACLIPGHRESGMVGTVTVK
ncbi:cupredoxin family protein [Bradyrhizobium sp. CIAT3101]|uniref:cupredoxin domain-containing protein n=1 Tax=Bradyrhizobium sp. CIAT3101 TaxID=439387 RepID=UPI0024B282FA|nr:cupredoxin family protein [Bradyrhizobium sp. CIAT3101]WFU80690.1 cupredoxin family protein [Bradyrhizobium sp. CIAT3101]